MIILKNGNLLIRFLLEISVLISIGYWGFTIKNGSFIVKVGLGVVVPIMVILAWGTFVAPKSSLQLLLPERLIVEFIVFALGAIALFASGHPVLGKVFIVTVIFNISLLLYWKQ